MLARLKVIVEETSVEIKTLQAKNKEQDDGIKDLENKTIDMPSKGKNTGYKYIMLSIIEISIIILCDLPKR